MRFIDTGFWYGLHTPSDRRHQDAVAVWRSESQAAVTTNLVLGET